MTMTTLPIPGTVPLIAHYSPSSQALKHDNDILLIPQPSASPRDPLNWTPARKNFNRMWQILWTYLGCTAIMSLSPAYSLVTADTGIGLAVLNNGIAIMYLFLGWANVIVQPLALTWLGRRPIMVGSLFTMSAVVLASAWIRDSGVWYLSRVLMGILYSPVESLVEVLVADLAFTHQRGFHMGVYSWTLFNGPFLSALVTGYVGEKHGWKMIQYIASGIGLGLAVLMFFFFEETMFFRETIQAEFISIEEDQEAKAGRLDEEGGKEKKAGIGEGSGGSSGEGQSAPPSIVVVEESPMIGNGLFAGGWSEYIKSLRMWAPPRSANEPRRSFRKSMILPFLLLRYPGVVFSGFLVGAALSWDNILNSTMSQVLSGEPYSFTPDQIGLMYLASVIGVTVGCFLSGWLSDVVSEWLARRNGGIKEPEHRLWLGAIALVCHPAGAILYGVGASHGIHWVGVAFGIGLLAMCIVMGSNIALTYVFDSYKEVAGEAMVSVILIRNTMGFAFTYAIAPMISSLGLQNAFITIAFLGVLFWVACMGVIFVGRGWRQSTAASYWQFVERHGLHAH